MTFGIKVSNIGKDVKSCDDSDLVMSSEISTLKTFGSQELEITGSFVHNLGYTPIFLYAVFRADKPLNINFVGQADGRMVASITDILYNAQAGDPTLVYVFYDEL